MKTWFKKYANLIIVSFLALVFFIAVSSFSYLSVSKDYTKWSSPDETANYFFTKTFSKTGQLAVFDPAAVTGDNIVIPRSVRSDFGWIKPVSFLGIILIYGSIASVLGVAVIPYLTPFFAALGIVFFYLIIRRLFNEWVGLWSAFLLAGFPVYIYYTVRAMFHNVLFISLLLIGIYFFLLALGNKKEADSEPRLSSFIRWKLERYYWLQMAASFTSGVFIGLAIITRTSELLWLAPCFLLIWLFYVRRLGLAKLIIFLAGVFLALLPAAYYNQVLYGSFFHGGYNAMNNSLDDIAKTSTTFWQFTWHGEFSYYRHYLGTIFRNVFYFGFNTDQSVMMFKHYIPQMFSWLFYGALGGLLLLIIQNCRRFQKKYLLYVLTGLVLSLILIFYYGSWKFNDNPDPTHFTIGNSYTRYWLPIYLFLIPLLSLVLVRVTKAIVFVGAKNGGRIRKLIAAGLQSVAIAAFISYSLMFVLFGSEEGLVYLYYNNQAEKTNAEKVWNLTENSAIIITRYYDKFFWPERRVIMGILPNDEILNAAKKLVQHYPLYYYTFYLNEADINYLNSRKLAPYDLALKLVVRTNTQFGLYKMTVTPNLNNKTDEKQK